MLLLACSGPPPEGGDYGLGTELPVRAPVAADASDAPTVEKDAAPEPRPLTTFAGTLAASTVVAFGGAPESCSYDITLKNIVVTMTVSSADEVVSMTVSDTATERALLQCPYAPAPPASQVFTLSNAVPIAMSGSRFQLAGAVTNQPTTTLFVELVAGGLGYDAALSWKRTDQSAKLNWAVAAKLSLLRN